MFKKFNFYKLVEKEKRRPRLSSTGLFCRTRPFNPSQFSGFERVFCEPARLRWSPLSESNLVHTSHRVLRRPKKRSYLSAVWRSPTPRFWRML